MRPPAHPARRLAAVIGLISAMLLTGGADRAVPGSRAAERATAATGEVRDEAGQDEASGHHKAGEREEANGNTEASGRDGTLGAVGDHPDGLTEASTDADDDTVDHNTDAADETVTDTAEAVDDPVDHTTDAVEDAVDHTTDAVEDGVGHTTGIVDELVDGTTDTLDSAVDRLSGDEQDPRASPPVEAPSPPADAAPSPADGEPRSPVGPAPPTAAAPSGAAPEDAVSGEEIAETDDRANGSATSDLDEPGSLFDGGGGISERAPFPLGLVVILAGFLGVQAWVDRRDPKLAAAPLETEPDLVFERP